MCTQPDQCLRHASKARSDLLSNLVSKYHKNLTIKASSIVGEIYAEEVVQDVWEILARGEVCLDDINSINHWLQRVVKNRSLNLNKRESRTVPLDYSGSDLFRSSNSLQSVDFRFTEYSTEDMLIGAQKLDALLDSWEALSPVQQRVIELRYSRDYSYHEIASELSMTLSNTKVSLHRAKAKLLSSN